MTPKESHDPQYFAAKEVTKCIEVLESKAIRWADGILTSGIVDKIFRSWAFYHGSYYNEYYDYQDHKIQLSGEQGEQLRFPVNHFRNIAQIMLNMTVANRPAMSARSINTDYKSLTQTTLANGLLDYYMREKHLETILKQATEYAIVLSEGWIKMEWDATKGEPIAYNEDNKAYIYEGDIRYEALGPLQVIRDIYKTETNDHDWLIIRSFRNKYDLAAKYPDYRDKIMAIETKDQQNVFKFGMYMRAESDDIPIFEFYHNRTDAMPDGRYILYCNKDTPLIDTPLPYKFIPCFKIQPSAMMGTPFGYTGLFDILPIQEAINMLYSIIATNQNAFGVQNILVPKGADVNYSQLAGGLNLIEYTHGFEPPKALNLTQTPPEVFNFLNKLESTMETISGVNSVVRGNPEASLRTGNALALVQAQAVQFMSGLQQSFVELVESVGTATIKMLQDFAQTPRVAAIVGKSNRSYLKEFSGEDLSNINRVVVELTNPVSRTTAGRLEMANNLLQYQAGLTPEQYFQVMDTGKLEVMTEGLTHELLLVKAENEKLMEGEQVPVLAIDAHLMHIKEHKSILFDPQLRKDGELVKNALDHIQEHINALRTVDPNLLQLIGQQPLPPEQSGQPPGGGGGDGGNPPPAAPPPGGPSGTPPKGTSGPSAPGLSNAAMAKPLPTGAEAAQEQAMPMMPRAAGNPNMPVSAQEGMAKLTGG